MKIFEKNPFKGKFASQNESKNKRKLFVGGELAVFFAAYSLISTSLSPSSLTVNEIRQVNASVDSVGGKYLGATLNGFYQGQGKFQHLKGGTYTGEFASSKRSGKGKFIWPNGDKYDGAWHEDNMTEGTYAFKDGRIYKGTFKGRNLIKGHVDFGKAATNYGFQKLAMDIDEGTVKTVVCKFKDGTSYDGAITGRAEIKYSSGNIYYGDVVNGVREGNGTYKWMSGATELSSYSGQWRSGQMNGEGMYLYTSEGYPQLRASFVNGRPGSSTAKYYKTSEKSFTTRWQDGKCIDNGG